MFFFNSHLVKTFHDGRDAALAEDGPDSVAVADAIAALARARLTGDGHPPGKDVDKFLDLLLLLACHHLLQIEQSSIGLQGQWSAKVLGHGQLTPQLPVAFQTADVPHRVHFFRIESKHVLN